MTTTCNFVDGRMSAINYFALLKEEKKKAREATFRAKATVSATSNDNEQNTSSDQSKVECEALLSLKLLLPEPCHWHLPNYRVGEIESIYYVPAVFDLSNQQAIEDCVHEVGKESGVWKVLRTRRLQCWGTQPDETGQTKISESNHSEEFPSWLKAVSEWLVHIGFFRDLLPNNVLINSYQASEGIVHHTDGPSYHSQVVIISLGSSCVMSFRHRLRTEEVGEKFGGDVFSVVLEPGSVLVFRDAVYSHYMHGIEAEPTHFVTDHCINQPSAGCMNITEVIDLVISL